MSDDTTTQPPAAKPTTAKSPAPAARKTPGRKPGAARAMTAAKRDTRAKPRATTAKRTSQGANVLDAVAASVTTAAAEAVAPIAATIAPARTATKKTIRKATKAVRGATAAARRETGAVQKRAAKATRKVRRAIDEAGTTVTDAATGSSAKALGGAAVGLLAGLAVNFGRKMLVQAPSALAGDWFAAIKAEHKLAFALFDKLQATDNSQTAQRTALLTHLKHALGKHAFTEENVIYPALRAWGDKADADKLNHDHGYVKQYLFELDAIDKGSSKFLAEVGDFRAALEAHVREEEDSIFPPLHKALGKEGNAKVTAQANKEGFKLA